MHWFHLFNFRWAEEYLGDGDHFLGEEEREEAGGSRETQGKHPQNIMKSSESTESLQTLLTWANACQCTILGKLTSSRTIISPKTITESIEIGQIPRVVVLHENYAAKCSEMTELLQALHQVTHVHRHRCLFLSWLCHERFNRSNFWSKARLEQVVDGFNREQVDLDSQDASPWFPYLNCLPLEFDDVLRWSPDALSHLSNTTLGNWVVSRQREVRDDYDFCRRFIHGEYFTYSNFLWAYSVVYSRSFPSSSHPFGQMEGERGIGFGLLPLIDMFNHSPTADVTWKTTPTHITFLANAGVPQGEIFNNYGPKSNQELLAGYGFVIDDDSREFLTVLVNPNATVDALFSRKRPFLQDDEHVVRRSDLNSLLKHVRVLCANVSELEVLEMGRTTETISLRNEFVALETIRRMFMSKLHAIESARFSVLSVEEERRGEMARIYKRGQVDILSTQISLIDARLDELLSVQDWEGEDVVVVREGGVGEDVLARVDGLRLDSDDLLVVLLASEYSAETLEKNAVEEEVDVSDLWRLLKKRHYKKSMVKLAARVAVNAVEVKEELILVLHL